MTTYPKGIKNILKKVNTSIYRVEWSAATLILRWSVYSRGSQSTQRKQQSLACKLPNFLILGFAPRQRKVVCSVRTQFRTLHTGVAVSAEKVEDKKLLLYLPQI